MSRTLQTLAGASLILLASCEAEDVLKPTSPTFQSVRQQTGRQTIDDRLAALADEIPGFGGLFYDSNGLTLNLKDVSRWSEARVSVADWFANRPDPWSQSQGVEDATVAGVKAVDYDYRELHTWYRRIMKDVARFDGIATLSISSRLNRIRVGVNDRTRIEAVGEAIEHSQIPLGAVNIEYRPGGIQLLTDLDDKVRPTIAGLGIGAVGEPHCTLGFNLDRTGTSSWYFVTASHCAIVATPDTFDMGQPYLSASNEIGGEVSDPDTFEHDDDSWCPDGSPSPQCRYSDASLYEYTGPNSDWHHGYVAWPNVSSTSYSVERQIVGKGDPLEGHTLHKIGMKTGRSYGDVDEECESQFVGPLGFWILCYLVIDDDSAERGDSGSPVVYTFGADALAAGVLFGRDTIAGTLAVSNIYSVFDEIEDDITLSANIDETLYC